MDVHLCVRLPACVRGRFYDLSFVQHKLTLTLEAVALNALS